MNVLIGAFSLGVGNIQDIHTKLDHIPDRGDILAEFLEVLLESKESSRDRVVEIIGLCGQRGFPRPVRVAIEEV